MKNSILGKARWLRDVALATSKNNGARVAREWLKYAAMFVMLFTIGSGNAWGADATISLDFEGSSGSWPYNSNWTCDASSNATNHTNGGSRSAGMSKNGSQYITCSLELTNIKQVTLWVNRTTNNTAQPTITIQKSTDGGKNWSDITGASQTFAIAKNEWAQKTFDFASYKYNGRVRIKYTNSTTAIKLIDDIVITYEEASCDNKVTISKGSETNGTFTISPSGSQASCDGVAVMVTPTPASSAYYCSAVSASTGETGIDNGNGTWTVNIAANTTGTSTINVTFSLKTSYTVTWYNEGVSIRTESVYSGDKVSALPSPAPTSSCSGEFIGWVRSDADVADKSVTDAYTIQPTAPTLFTDVAGSPTITGNTAFHAVYRMPKQD